MDSSEDLRVYGDNTDVKQKKKKKNTRKVKSFRPSTPEKNNHTSWFKATYSVLT